MSVSQSSAARTTIAGVQLVIEYLWDGSDAHEAERVTLELRATPGHLEIAVDAPFHGDPAPDAPPGRVPGLWEYEVVELFLHATGHRYLEIELGPHGHYLALRLDGIRNIVDPELPLEFTVERPAPHRWRGRARLARDLLPPGLARYNAHAIHGQADARRYLSAHPAGGARPDFHRPEVTAALDPVLLDALSLPLRA